MLITIKSAAKIQNNNENENQNTGGDNNGGVEEG